ncbi:MAG: helix-turn-helix domain containing protein, partial [Planctomycetes bacterium]|nr:helix-turn-helix domain containing protein [Planctomycetota bacterium]
NEEAVRERLKIAFKNFSQAEVARRVKTSRNNVNRYLREGRIPVEFCARVVAGLGINATWLLTGSGAPFVTEVEEPVGKRAENVLGLVESMQAIAKMRIGALGDKKGAHQLRALNEALGAHERLQSQLGDQSRSALRQQLDEFDAALKKNDIGRAVEIRNAARETMRLVPDDVLGITLENLEGTLELRRGRIEQATECFRHAFLRSLYGRQQLTVDDLNGAGNYIGALRLNYRMREARRVCKAVLALADGLKTSDEYWRLVLSRCFIDLCLGNMNRAMAGVHLAFKHLSAVHQKTERGLVMGFQICSGTLDPADALTVIRDLKGSVIERRACGQVANMILHLPNIDKNPDVALEAARLAVKWAELSPFDNVYRAWNSHLLDHYESEAKNLAQDFLADESIAGLRKTSDPIAAFRIASAAANLAWLGGDEALAREEIANAEEAIRAFTEQRAPTILFLAIHHENVIQTQRISAQPASLQTQAEAARRFFRKYFHRGYGCFAACMR